MSVTDTRCFDNVATHILRCQARPDQREDIPHTAFWLYNATLLLHLMKCDQALAGMCESLEIFFLLEELIRSLYGLCGSLCH